MISKRPRQLSWNFEYKNPWLDIFGHEIGPRMATTVNLIFAPWNSKEKNILLANDPVYHTTVKLNKNWTAEIEIDIISLNLKILLVIILFW